MKTVDIRMLLEYQNLLIYIIISTFFIGKHLFTLRMQITLIVIIHMICKICLGSVKVMLVFAYELLAIIIKRDQNIQILNFL